MTEKDGTPRPILEPILCSPIFVFDDLPDEKLVSLKNDDVLKQIVTEANLLPFKFMRLYINSNVTDRSRDGTRGIKMWIAHEGGRIVIWSSIQPQLDDAIIQIVSYGEVLSGAIIVNGKQSSESNTATNLISALFTSFCWFVREVNSPANFIASSCPNSQGKSVEWQKARTHYVILHRNHPANSKWATVGDNVTPDAGYIKRQAHTRRAHSRILRSPKFKNKIGQTIRIKSCWVGPKEWKQSGSIYRLKQ